jgi:serine/threonine protein kinase
MHNGSTPKKALRFEEPTEGDQAISHVEMTSPGPVPPFGRYVIRERMGQGGMAEVFLAHASGADGFEKPVVIKRLLPQFARRADVVSLLSAEAKLMTRLLHPNIVQVIDFGHGDRDDYFLVLELVKGTDLGRLCRNFASRAKALPVPLALYIVSQILRGLAYVHDTAAAVGQKLVHRDISPGNILLSAFGEVKVTDFGIALVASSNTEIRDSYIVGNPAYMAPEQLDRAPVDERADIYGAGAVLFHMLTGTSHQRRPPEAPYATDLSEASRARLARAVRQPLVELVERALALRPDDRFSAAREMTRRIEQIVAGGERMASADTLAEIVCEFLQREPSGSKPVIVLSAGPSDDLSTGTELRIADSEDQDARGFSIRVQRASRSALPALRSMWMDSPSARWATFAIAAVSAMAVLFFRAHTHRSELGSQTTAQLALLPGPVSQEEVPPLRTPRSEIAAADALRATLSDNAVVLAAHVESSTTSAHPIRRFERLHSQHPAVHGASSSAPYECRGQLHVYAAHGWLVSGGPSTVQAPGRYEWPCGAYSLKITSRTNNLETRSIAVSIRRTVPEVVDLR